MSLSPRAPSFQSQPVFLLVFVNQYSSITLPSSILTSLSGSDPLYFIAIGYSYMSVLGSAIKYFTFQYQPVLFHFNIIQYSYISVSTRTPSIQCQPLFLHVCVSQCSFISMPASISTRLYQPLLIHFNASQYSYSFMPATPPSFQCQPVFLHVYASHFSFISMLPSFLTCRYQPVLFHFSAMKYSFMSTSASGPSFHFEYSYISP